MSNNKKLTCNRKLKIWIAITIILEHTHTHLMALCLGLPGEPVPERYKKLSYRQGTARCVVSVEILPTATQQCSASSPEQIEVMKLEG